MKLAIDVDGVVADFVGGVRAGLGLPVDWFPTQWDLEIDLLIAPQLRLYNELIAAPEFARNLQLYPQSQAAVKLLQACGATVCFCTSPMRSSHTWSYDRHRWLDEFFPGVPVVVTKDKQWCDAHALIDDKPSNISGRVGFLIRRPWNTEAHKELAGHDSLADFALWFLRVGQWTVTNADSDVMALLGAQSTRVQFGEST